MGFHGPISKNAARSTAWDTVLPSRALSHHKIPHVLWGDFLWAAAFRVPTSCLHTIYFVVPNDRVDAAVKAISTDPSNAARTSRLERSCRLSRYSGTEVYATPHRCYPWGSSRVRSDRYGAYYHDRVRPQLHPGANVAGPTRLMRRCTPYLFTAATEPPWHNGLVPRTHNGGCTARV